MKILVVDDDPDLLGVTTFALQQAGFLVVRAADGEEALTVFGREQPDLAVLDINLPKLGGFALARAIRQQSAIPMIMLTVRDAEEDVVKALALGADDYLTKPFSPRVLIARIRALLRRAGNVGGDILAVGEMKLDLDNRALAGLAEEPIRLTRLETRFLQLMFANAGRTVVADRLIAHVWGSDASGNRQMLKQLVHRLRQKIEPQPRDPRLLLTVQGAGYRLDAAGAAADAGLRAVPGAAAGGSASARSSEAVDDRQGEGETEPHDDLQRDTDP